MMQKINGWSRWETLILIALFAVLAWFAISPKMPFGDIKLGMTLDEAIKIAGRPPGTKHDAQSFPKAIQGSKGDCAKANVSDGFSWNVWNLGLDNLWIVVLDKNGKVVFTGSCMD